MINQYTCCDIIRPLQLCITLLSIPFLCILFIKKPNCMVIPDGITTVIGHKYFIKFQIPIDLCVFPSLHFIFSWVNKKSFRKETYILIKQNKFYIEILFVKVDTIEYNKTIAV